MTDFLNVIVQSITTAPLDAPKLIALAYIGLLWISIIVWVTRDSIDRSDSLIFQVFAIVLNIVIPILGVLLYLIVRPAKTSMERYYEEIEQRILTETSDSTTCEHCLTAVEKTYLFCPNCGEKLMKACASCKKPYPPKYAICPFCGKKDEGGHAHKKESKTAKK